MRIVQLCFLVYYVYSNAALLQTCPSSLTYIPEDPLVTHAVPPEPFEMLPALRAGFEAWLSLFSFLPILGLGPSPHQGQGQALALVLCFSVVLLVIFTGSYTSSFPLTAVAPAYWDPGPESVFCS